MTWLVAEHHIAAGIQRYPHFAGFARLQIAQLLDAFQPRFVHGRTVLFHRKGVRVEIRPDDQEFMDRVRRAIGDLNTTGPLGTEPRLSIMNWLPSGQFDIPISTTFGSTPNAEAVANNIATAAGENARALAFNIRNLP